MQVSALRRRQGQYAEGRYRGCLSARLWWRPGGLTGTVLLGLALGGCSFSYQLDSLFGKKEDTSLRLQTAPTLKPVNDTPPEGDLVMARAAVSEVMTKS